MKQFIINLIVAIIIVFIGLVIFYNLPLFSLEKIETEQTLGATVTEITSTDKLSTFPTTYNANLNALNNGKLENSLYYATTTHANISSLPSLATVGTIGTGVWQGTDVGVAYGGTGVSTLGANLVLLGNGTGSIQTVAAGSNDQVLTLVGGVPAWTSASVDETLQYAWTGKHSWTTGTTTFNSDADFNSGVTLDGYTQVASLQIASSSTNQWATASTSIVNKGFLDNNRNFVSYYLSASDNLQASADTVNTDTDGSYNLDKEINVYKSGEIRVKFDMKSGGGGTVYGKIYVNGSAVGTERLTSGTSYTTYSEDIYVDAGDSVQLYSYGPVATCYTQNFRLYFDVNEDGNTEVITD